MKFNLLITGALYSSQSAYSALQFCRAAVAARHHIVQVFFYQDGVGNSNALSLPLDDEFNATEQWAEFATAESIALVACVSAAERRGVLSEEQAAENAKAHNNLHPAFEIGGLGVLHQASLESDRTVTFK